MPQNSVNKVEDFEAVCSGINMGNCLLFIDTLNIAFDIDVKKYNSRGVDKPENEVIIKGPQESFIENIRTNTSLLRKIVNNENLIIENIPVGNISKTKCGVCYMKNIANSDLVGEVKFRLSNLSIVLYFLLVNWNNCWMKKKPLVFLNSFRQKDPISVVNICFKVE